MSAQIIEFPATARSRVEVRNLHGMWQVELVTEQKKDLLALCGNRSIALIEAEQRADSLRVPLKVFS